MSRSPVKLLRQFEVSSPFASSRKGAVFQDPTFASALASQSPHGKTGENGRDEELRLLSGGTAVSVIVLFGLR